jgi:hypothetical protein
LLLADGRPRNSWRADTCFDAAGSTPLPPPPPLVAMLADELCAEIVLEVTAA